MILRLIGLSVLLPSLLFAAPAAEERAVPHFVVVTDGASLPLREQTASVTLAGVGAHVRLTQRYENGGATPIEARYVFPASTRAAVFAMRVKHAGRTIEAQIASKENAQQEYDAALSAGYAAALLQQHRPNVLEMAVANIAPRESVVVEVEYVELVRPVDGKYEWVLPGVAGPRYVSPDGDAPPVPGSPTATKGVAVPLERWQVDLRIESGLPIFAIQSPSHRIDPRFEPGRREAELRLEDRAAADRDLVIEYWLAGGAIETGMMVAPDADGDGGYFLLQVEPPARVAPKDVLPREYVFVLDVSGSMDGFPIATAKQLLDDLLGTLRPVDRFNGVLFAGRAATFEPRSVAASEENLARFRTFIAEAQSGGGTELLPALEAAFGLPGGTPKASRAVVVITDGLVAEESAAFRLVRERLGTASVFAFGIGDSVNRHLIEGLAHAGRAEAFVVDDSAVASGKANDFREYIASPILQGVSAAFDGFDAYLVEPATLPDVFARRPLAMLGRYHGKAAGRVRVSGTTSDGRWSRELSPTATLDGPALRLLWARERIARLELEEKSAGSADSEIEALGLEHSLLTRRTSFVAVDRSRRIDGKAKRVDQTVPLPHRVEESAIGTHAFAPGSVGGYAIVPGRVLPTAEERAQSRQARASLQSLLPVHTFLLPLRFARPAEVVQHLTPFLSKVGRINVDDRTNSLLIQDHREELERIRELARVFDVPAPTRGPAVIATRVELSSGSGIDTAAVIDVIDRNLLQVRACYRDAVRKNPALSGTLIVGIDVDPAGRVTAVALEDGTLPYAGGTLEQCLLDELASLSFPAAKEATESHLTVDLVFGATAYQR